MQATRIPTRSSALITCWPGTASGRVGIRSWSLAKAMFEPQKETEPIDGGEQDRDQLVERDVASRRPWRNSDQAISATAPPPTPL